jgi:hypothetical protein
MDQLEEHFFMTIAAPRKSGKSYLVKEMLKNGLLDHFDHVVIMCPTLEFNKDYADFRKNKKVSLIHNVTERAVNELFTRQAACQRRVLRRDDGEKCPKTLLILDDCIDSNVIRFGGVVEKFAERGRHIGLSGLVCTQRLSAASRSIRLNSDYILIFSPYSVSEMDQFLEQFVGRDERKTVRAATRRVFKKPYQFIVLDNADKNISTKLKTSNAEDFIKGHLSPLILPEDAVVEKSNKVEKKEPVAEEKPTKRPRNI